MCFVALLWSKNGEAGPIPLCIIKTHFANNKNEYADNKSELE